MEGSTEGHTARNIYLLEKNVDEVAEKIQDPDNKEYFDKEVKPVFDQLVQILLNAGGHFPFA